MTVRWSTVIGRLLGAAILTMLGLAIGVGIRGWLIRAFLPPWCE